MAKKVRDLKVGDYVSAWLHVCEGCGERFVGRRDAIVCSGTCRQKKYRRRPDVTPHHAVWLETRPHRSPEWFWEHLADGFDIHHLDGDHENNDPSNLALIEHSDHFMLHNGGTYNPGRLGRKGGKRSEPSDADG